MTDQSSVLGGTGITVRDDRSICAHAGFCGTRLTNVWGQVPETSESTVRAQVISMIEKCPSGALTFRFDGDDVEPLLPAAIAVTDDGPLWVTGGISISRSDGTTLETRNRVTLPLRRVRQQTTVRRQPRDRWLPRSRVMSFTEAEHAYLVAPRLGRSQPQRHRNRPGSVRG